MIVIVHKARVGARREFPSPRRQASVAQVLPGLGALSNALDQNTLRRLESRARIGAQNIVVDFSPDGSDFAHCFSGCVDFRIGRHGAAPSAAGVKRNPGPHGRGFLVQQCDHESGGS